MFGNVTRSHSELRISSKFGTWEIVKGNVRNEAL